MMPDERPSAPLPFLQLVCWPARDQPAWAMLVAGGCVGVGCLVQQATARWEWGVAAGGLFVALAWRTWIPVRFELDVRGIRWGVWRMRNHLPWEHIASSHRGRQGVVVEAAVGPWALYLGNHRADELERVVRFYQQLPTTEGEGTTPTGDDSTIAPTPHQPSA